MLALDAHVRGDERAFARHRGFAFCHFQRLRRRNLANHLAVLVHRCQGHAEEIRVGKISASHDRDVLGNAQSRIEDGAHGAQRDRIVEAEDAIGTRLDAPAA